MNQKNPHQHPCEPCNQDQENQANQEASPTLPGGPTVADFNAAQYAHEVCMQHNKKLVEERDRLGKELLFSDQRYADANSLLVSRMSEIERLQSQRFLLVVATGLIAYVFGHTIWQQYHYSALNPESYKQEQIDRIDSIRDAEAKIIAASMQIRCTEQKLRQLLLTQQAREEYARDPNSLPPPPTPGKKNQDFEFDLSEPVPTPADPKTDPEPHAIPSPPEPRPDPNT